MPDRPPLRPARSRLAGALLALAALAGCRPVLVCEVRYDHFSGTRFRHGTKFLRWRPDKRPEACTLDQVKPRAAGPLLAHLGAG